MGNSATELEENITEQLHQSATTTVAIRHAIQQSQRA